jgi:flavin reductase (DIM6/NTAB) family NADH-FMN oxidoreductase RutF
MRRFAGRFTTGVAVVTTRDAEGKCHGITMNAVTSLSLNPPLYIVCLSTSSNTLRGIQSTGRLAINFLASEQQELSNTFASKSDDKFRNVSYELGEHGSPLIQGAVAQGECIVEKYHEGGDHTIVVARVLRTEVNDTDPLLYHAGKLISLKELVAV